MNKNTGLLIAAGVGLWLLSKRGSGPGGVNVNGQVSAVDVSGGILMGTHGVVKNPGDSIFVSAAFNAGTTRGGIAIPWNYRLITTLLTPSGSVLVAAPIITINGISGAQASQSAGVMTTPNKINPAIDEIYDVQVALYAAQPDAAGNPTGVFLPLGALTHVNAVRVPASTVTTGGSVSSVNVSQYEPGSVLTPGFTPAHISQPYNRGLDAEPMLGQGGCNCAPQ